MNNALVTVALVGVGLVSFMVGANVAYEPPKPPQPEIVIPDFVAVGFFDCNELHSVVFFDSAGRSEGIKVDSPARLLDVQLRLADVAYERVQWLQNARPCGFDASQVGEIAQ